jgi:hypothetical protein
MTKAHYADISPPDLADTRLNAGEQIVPGIRAFVAPVVHNTPQPGVQLAGAHCAALREAAHNV